MRYLLIFIITAGIIVCSDSSTDPEGERVTSSGGLRASCIGGHFNPNC